MSKLVRIILAMALVFTLLAGCSPKAPAPTPAPAAPAATAPAAPAPAAPAPAAPTPKEPMGPKVNLSFAMYLPEADPTTKDLVRYLQMIKDATEGTVDYTVYAGGTLSPAPQELDAVRKGLADVTFFPVAYGSGNLPQGFLLEYPGVNFASGKAGGFTVSDWYNQVKPKEIADLKLLFAMGQGNGIIMTTFPVTKFEDFKGRQIRSGDSQAPIVKAYGATPTVMVFSEVYEALRNGVVQGFYGLAAAGMNAKLYEVTKSAVKDPFYFGTYLMVMNQGKWDSLSAAQQKAITDTTTKAFDEFLAAGRDADTKVAYEAFEKAGCKVVEFDQANLDKMIGASGYLQKDYAKELDTKNLDGTKNLELFFSLAEKYNALYK